jgi:hypothetical protein
MLKVEAILKACATRKEQGFCASLLWLIAGPLGGLFVSHEAQGTGTL